MNEIVAELNLKSAMANYQDALGSIGPRALVTEYHNKLVMAVAECRKLKLWHLVNP